MHSPAIPEYSLNADALFSTMKTGFDKIEDHRPGIIQHSLGNTLVSGFAMFSLKDPSLLAFGVFASMRKLCQGKLDVTNHFSHNTL